VEFLVKLSEGDAHFVGDGFEDVEGFVDFVLEDLSDGDWEVLYEVESTFVTSVSIDYAEKRTEQSA
jgi:hypothetical protein